MGFKPIRDIHGKAIITSNRIQTTLHHGELELTEPKQESQREKL